LVAPTSTPAVTTLAELRSVTHAPISQSLVHTDAPPLRLPEATGAELRDWQRRLDQELYACGCNSGAVTLLAGLASLAIAQFALGVDTGSGLRLAAVWIAVAFAAALGGKAAGLLWARRRRLLLYAEIARTLTERGHISAQPIDGGRREDICAVSVSD
jgi:hypothetical protein